MGKIEFCKRGFGERSNSSLERVRRGEEDGIVGGGQGGIGGDVQLGTRTSKQIFVLAFDPLSL